MNLGKWLLHFHECLENLTRLQVIREWCRRGLVNSRNGTHSLLQLPLPTVFLFQRMNNSHCLLHFKCKVKLQGGYFGSRRERADMKAEFLGKWLTMFSESQYLSCSHPAKKWRYILLYLFNQTLSSFLPPWDMCYCWRVPLILTSALKIDRKIPPPAQFGLVLNVWLDRTAGRVVETWRVSDIESQIY